MKNVHLFLNSKGSFTLVTLLIILSVNLSVQLLFTKQIIQLKKLTLKTDLLATQQQIINEMDNLTVFKGSILEESFKHSQLKNCIEEAGDCTTEDITDLSLTLPDGQELVNDGKRLISSVGSNCSDWSYHCPFKQLLTVTPFCPDESLKCNKAEGLLFYFEVMIYPKVQQEFALTTSIKKEIYISDMLISGGTSVVTKCPPGQIIKMFNGDGSIECDYPQDDIDMTHFKIYELGIGSFWPLNSLFKKLLHAAIKKVVATVKAKIVSKIQEIMMEKIISALDLEMDNILASLLAQEMNKYIGDAAGDLVDKGWNIVQPPEMKEAYEKLQNEVKGYMKEEAKNRIDWANKLESEINDSIGDIAGSAQVYTQELLNAIGMNEIVDGVSGSIEMDNYLANIFREAIDKLNDENASQAIAKLVEKTLSSQKKRAKRRFLETGNFDFTIEN